MKPLSTDPVTRRTSAWTAGIAIPAQRSAPSSENPIRGTAEQDGVRTVRFDRPLLRHELGWADPVVADRIAEIERTARKQAHSLGYAAGWAEGRKAAAERERDERSDREQRHRAQLQEQSQQTRRLLSSLAQSALTERESALPAWAEAAELLVDGAMRIAKAALARELSAVDDPTADAVRTALGLIEDNGEIQVRVSPSEINLLTQLVTQDLPEKVRIVPDSAVTPGTVQVISSAQRLLYDIPAALTRAEEVLRG